MEDLHEREVFAKVARRLLPVLIIAYVLNYLETIAQGAAQGFYSPTVVETYVSAYADAFGRAFLMPPPSDARRIAAQRPPSARVGSKRLSTALTRATLPAMARS